MRRAFRLPSRQLGLPIARPARPSLWRRERCGSPGIRISREVYAASCAPSRRDGRGRRECPVRARSLQRIFRAAASRSRADEGAGGPKGRRLGLSSRSGTIAPRCRSTTMRVPTVVASRRCGRCASSTGPRPARSAVAKRRARSRHRRSWVAPPGAATARRASPAAMRASGMVAAASAVADGDPALRSRVAGTNRPCRSPPQPAQLPGLQQPVDGGFPGGNLLVEAQHAGTALLQRPQRSIAPRNGPADKP